MRSDFFWMGGMLIFPMMMFGIMLIVMIFILFSIFGKNGTFPCSKFKKDHSPLDIVKERYAKGEITRDEFERMKKELSD
ncbi:SHOCT domain-containing protein [Ilyobacter sp.]|uniref:SHOCT domain-containing protein n=1 Tax=Ilyobacter sp. TaxID=3100343 RepID=UPI00356AA50E